MDSRDIQLAKTSLAEACVGLTDAQRLYVEARAQGLNKTAAGKFAGLSEGNLQKAIRRMEAHPKVRTAMSEAAKLTAAKLEITRTDAVQGMLDALPMCATATEVIMAWREIAKLLGHYAAEKVEINVNRRDLTAERLATLPTSELMKLVGSPPPIAEGQSEALSAEFEVLSSSLQEPEPIDVEPEPE